MFIGCRAAVTASLVALAVAVGACGGAKEGSTPSAGQKATAQKLIDIAATPRDQVKDGGTMRWPLDQFSSQWNYNQVDGQTQATFDVVYATLPILFVADEHTTVTANPDYVASFDVSTSPQVVTLKLNPKAKWSDGRPITWQDFAAQAKALSGKDSAYSIGSSTGYERISSVKAGADQFEVVITFARPFGEWQSLFTPLYPKQADDTPKHFNTSYLDHIPVTAGPFKVDKLDKSAQSLRIVRDPRWWGKAAKLDAIAYNSPELEAQVNAFANGEVDRVNIGADASLVKRATNTQGGGVRVAGGPDFRQFTLNGTSTVLKDVQVRRALALSINRAVIARSDLTGLNWPAVTMDNHFFVNTQKGYVDNAGEFAKFDPARARTLLDGAGWKQSGAFRKKAGKPLKLTFVIPSGVPASRQEAELAQAMAKDVGIQIVIKTVPSDPFFDDYIIPGNFDLTVFSFIGNAFPISPNKSIYVKPKKDAKGELQVQQNFARIGSPAIDKLLSSAEEQVDVAKGRELANQADKLIWNEVHSLVLFQRPQNIAVSDNVVNVGAFGFKTPRYQDMGFKK
ncbi:MAG: glutathione transport system substrate-binding protein [Solirubrobacteraceae bacterium]|nr:glutathione transport system substrate-binding protein [Solirubrobacteraceae bacterium]MEA2139660.1 glutathione transport system substrate-binding protein [Solirubrobacteraceae bacterium]